MSKRNRKRKGPRPQGSTPLRPAPPSPVDDDDDVDDSDGDFEEDDDGAIVYSGADVSIEWRGTGGRVPFDDDTPVPMSTLVADAGGAKRASTGGGSGDRGASTRDMSSGRDVSSGRDASSSRDPSRAASSNRDALSTRNPSSTRDPSSTRGVLPGRDSSSTHDSSSTRDSASVRDGSSTRDTRSARDRSSTRDNSSTRESSSARGGSSKRDSSSTRDAASTPDAGTKRAAKRDADTNAKRGKPTAAEPRGFGAAWNDFFFAARDPRLASVLRIGFALIVLVNLAVLAPDLRLWFSEDGLVPAATGEQIINEHALSLFSYLPHTDTVLYACFGVFVAQAVLLLLGWYTRVQAIGVFIWLVTFQHRNYAIVDGEDTVLRMFAFYLALCPAGWAFSLDALRRKPETPPPAPWALRLFQIQMSIIYLSSAIEKSLGTHWTGGRALYYIARLDDAFGKWPMPSYPFESFALIKIMTWGVLALEWLLPVLLWMKRTRKLALVVAIVFHLAIDYTMNLFLFHWIMILGLLSFAEYDDLARLKFWRRG